LLLLLGIVAAASDSNDAAGGQLGSASFLAARVLPVDAYKIRNGLFLSQPLRIPAAASVNVLETEDTTKMYEKAKYMAMKGKASRLKHEVESKLLLLAAPL
jgi:hypothetical protein